MSAARYTIARTLRRQRCLTETYSSRRAPASTTPPRISWNSAQRKGKVTVTQVNDPKEAPNDPSYFEQSARSSDWPGSLGRQPGFAQRSLRSTRRRASPKGGLAAESHERVGLAHGRQHGQCHLGQELQRLRPGWRLRRRCAGGDELPDRAHHQHQHGRCLLRTQLQFLDDGRVDHGQDAKPRSTFPPRCETGASTLQVIVNGIASKGTAVTLS